MGIRDFLSGRLPVSCKLIGSRLHYNSWRSPS